MRSVAECSTAAADLMFDLRQMSPGDIVLTRIPMRLDDDSSWISHVIQRATASRFSHATLYLGDGLCIEAVGTGIAPLPVVNAGIHTAGNVCVLRPCDSGRGVAAAQRAAACGRRYLRQGYVRPALPAGKGSAFDHPRRAAAQHLQLILCAYADADFFLVPDTGAAQASFADLLSCVRLCDVTACVLRPAPAAAPDYYLDDRSLFERSHHWEVMTKLKVLCSDEVKRVLQLHRERPNSFAELEAVLAQYGSRQLDLAVLRRLDWYRYAEVYLHRQLRVLEAADDHPGRAAAVPLQQLDDADLDALLARARGERHKLDVECRQRAGEEQRYAELGERYAARTFTYLGALQHRLRETGLRALQIWQRRCQALQQESRRRDGAPDTGARRQRAAPAQRDSVKV